jgi:hypothetical protein
MLLCDYAEDVNGKLYIVGGGWNTILADTPSPVALAILLAIPWDQANRPHTIKVALLTEDGEEVMVEDNPVLRVEGKLEVGRPPGTRPGSSLNAPLSIRLPALPLAEGGYRFEFSVDGTVLVAAPFTAVAPPGG